MNSTRLFSQQIDELADALKKADAILIGAGAGLSTAAGFSYAGERFKRHFSDFAEKYGFHDMYAGGFYPYATPEEYWAFWSRQVMLNRYTDTPEPLYQILLEGLGTKDYFVLTTNVDHCFQKAGFDKKRLFYTQGDFGLFQCSLPCRQETYDNEREIRQMVRQQEGMRIPSSLVPHCPRCGRLLTMNVRIDSTFVEDEGWHEAARRYAAFLRRYEKKRLVLLELGVGNNTPGIIKYPFWEMTGQNPNARYACINTGEAVCPPEIRNRAICLDADLRQALTALLAARRSCP